MVLGAGVRFCWRCCSVCLRTGVPADAVVWSVRGRGRVTPGSRGARRRRGSRDPPVRPPRAPPGSGRAPHGLDRADQPRSRRRRAGPAPLARPGWATAGAGRRRRRERPPRRRVEQRASPAGRPPAVWHNRCPPPAVAAATAARASTSRRPFLVRRATSTSSRARNGRERRGELVRAPRRAARPARRRRRSGRPASRCPRPPRRTPGRRRRPAARRPGRPAPASGSRALGQPDLQVLGLAGRPGRGRAEVGDLRVRGEPGGERHRDLRPAQRPLQRPGQVAVGGEPQPAALGVADAQLLHRRRRRGPLGLAGHYRPTTVSGSRLRPVGPIWISVPMVGQTPQS